MTGDGSGSGINRVQFQDSSTFVSVNGLGQLQQWDIRLSKASAMLTMRDDSESNGQLHTVSVHPDQPNKVLTGGSDGVLSVWDLRHPTYAIN